MHAWQNFQFNLFDSLLGVEHKEVGGVYCIILDSRRCRITITSTRTHHLVIKKIGGVKVVLNIKPNDE